MGSKLPLRPEDMPLLSRYVRNRGWHFIISWCHRLSGLFLTVFLLFHIYTLSSLQIPDVYNAKMKVLGFIVFGLLEWALAIPVVFHALNGGRLILYESFGCRNDDVMVAGVLGLSLLYLLLLAFVMIAGNQSVSTPFFWLTSLLAACCMTWAALRRIWASPNSLFWRVQRVTGAYLLVMIPAHMLFMHLNTEVAHNAQIVLMRMSNPFMKAIDLSLVLAVAYHGGYGVISVLGDYISPRILTTIASALAVMVMLFLAFTGVRLIFST